MPENQILSESSLPENASEKKIAINQDEKETPESVFAPRKLTRTSGEKLTRWLMFSVIYALLPIILNAFILLVKNELSDFNQLVKNGELLLISAAICATAVGELFTSGQFNVRKIIAGGVTNLILILSSSLFAIFSSTGQNSSTFISICFFIFAIITGGVCILFSETDDGI